MITYGETETVHRVYGLWNHNDVWVDLETMNPLANHFLINGIYPAGQSGFPQDAYDITEG